MFERKIKLETKATGEIVYGNVSYDQNHWIIEGEEKPFNNYRILLAGDVPRHSLVLIKRVVSGEERLAGITGEQQWSSGYTVSYLEGGQGCVHPEEVAEILDRDFYLHSPIYRVAEFYAKWKRKDQLVCPKCKREFHYEGWECSRCKRNISLSDKTFQHIELTDEMVKKHNAEVIVKKFIEGWENNTGYRAIKKGANEYSGYIAEDYPERMMERGAEIQKYYDILSDEQLQQLRETFKVCYSFLLETLKKRKAKEAARV